MTGCRQFSSSWAGLQVWAKPLAEAELLHVPVLAGWAVEEPLGEDEHEHELRGLFDLMMHLNESLIVVVWKNIHAYRCSVEWAPAHAVRVVHG